MEDILAISHINNIFFEHNVNHLLFSLLDVRDFFSF